jgi:hypothetical protein
MQLPHGKAQHLDGDRRSRPIEGQIRLINKDTIGRTKRYSQFGHKFSYRIRQHHVFDPCIGQALLVQITIEQHVLPERPFLHGPELLPIEKRIDPIVGLLPLPLLLQPGQQPAQDLYVHPTGKLLLAEQILIVKSFDEI